LYDVAAISSGYELADPAAFAKRVVALMGSGEEGLASLATVVAEQPVAAEPEADKPIEPEVL
jgi:hypothetical protein